MPRAQIIAIFGALALFVLLLFANTTPPKVDKTKMAAANSEEDLEAVVADAANSLTGTSKAHVSEYLKAFDHATTEQKLSFSDSLSKTWDRLKRPDIAAYYAEKKAIIADKPELWNKAGERYYNAVRFAQADKRPILYQHAISCFEKVLNREPRNLDAKTSLGACYVEGTADPMKGIGLLREVIAQDSTHINAQLNLAFFSIKSGQFEKGIDRFNKVLKIDPAYVEAYLFLADAYERTGNKQKAIETLEKYVTLVDDVTIKNEVNTYINKLKQS
jgi:tetratricopeptide (TPR) repeat protein